jgi:hypothetical protein
MYTKTRHALAFAAALLAAVGLSSCDRHHDSDVAGMSGLPASASPSAKLIGVAPAEPTGDPPGTSPVAANTTDISKAVETTKKPQEGDNHSHSTVAPTTPQKSDGKNTTPN